MSKKWSGYGSLFYSSSSSRPNHPRHDGHDDESDGISDHNGRTPVSSSSSKISMELSKNDNESNISLGRPNDSHDDDGRDDYYVIPSSLSSDQATTDTTMSPSRHRHAAQQQQRHHHHHHHHPHSTTSSTTFSTTSLDIEDAIDRLGMGTFQRQIVTACGLCFGADAMEILLLSFLAVILQGEWSLQESQVDSLISVVFVGAMMGTVALSTLGDWLGRKPVFVVTAALIGVFGIATAFCTTYRQVLLARFLVGFGIGGLTVPYDALSEFMPTSYRGKNLLSTSFFWTGGSLLVPFLAWLTLGNDKGGSGDDDNSKGSWRAFVTLCALPCVFSTVLGVFLVPESPRWLVTRGKNEKALRILRRAVARNGRDPYLTFPEGTRLIDRHAVAKTVASTVGGAAETSNDDSEYQDDEAESFHQQTQQRQQQKCSNHDHPKNGCWLLCSTRQLRKVSTLLGFQWYGLAFVYYGAIIAVSIVFSDASAIQEKTAREEGNESSGGVGGYEFDYSAIVISSSAEILGLILAILTVDRFGRVRTQVWTYFLGGLCILVLGLLDFYVGGDVQDVPHTQNVTEPGNWAEQVDQKQERSHLILFAFLARMFIMAATSITWLHTAELLPTEIRATGHGLANAMGRIGGITCPFIITESTSLRTIGVIMLAVSSITAVFSFNLPETAGMALGNFERIVQGQPIMLEMADEHTPKDDEKGDDVAADLEDRDLDAKVISSFEIL